jgi:hypothetical protein
MRDTIDMAREAGFPFNKYGLLQGDDDGEIDADKMFKAFEALVRADQIEKDAKMAETLGVHPGLNVWSGGPEWYKHGKDIAKAIRARGNT